MVNKKPYVTVATVCEKILQEKDGVFSAIRIVDQVNFSSPESFSEGMQFPLHALVCLKAGDVVGKFELSLKVRKPDGTAFIPNQKWPVTFGHTMDGINIVLNFALSLSTFGQYWIDVLWDGEMLTSFPIKFAKESDAKVDAN